jgi:hypothetical protein
VSNPRGSPQGVYSKSQANNYADPGNLHDVNIRLIQGEVDKSQNEGNNRLDGQKPI